MPGVATHLLSDNLLFRCMVLVQTKKENTLHIIFVCFDRLTFWAVSVSAFEKATLSLKHKHTTCVYVISPHLSKSSYLQYYIFLLLLLLFVCLFWEVVPGCIVNKLLLACKQCKTPAKEIYEIVHFKQRQIYSRQKIAKTNAKS